LGCIATPTKIKLGYQVVLALYIDIVVNRGTKRKLHNVNKDLRKHKSFTTFSDNYFNNRNFFSELGIVLRISMYSVWSIRRSCWNECRSRVQV